MTTIKDVAKHAGVSTGTVSMVMNNNPAVKLETRMRVLQAVEELHYTPNQYARSLVTQRRNVVGVVRTVVTSKKDAYRGGYHFDELPDTYLADMLDSIVAEVTRMRYSMLFDVLAWGEEDVLQDAELPAMAQDGRVDGLIWVSGLMSDAHKQLLVRSHLPVVTVGSRFDCFDWVDTDPEMGIYMMTKYVISCGHRKIAFINGLNNTQTAGHKNVGFLRAMEEAGLEVDDRLMDHAGYSGIGGYNAMKRIWERSREATAVVTALDILAVGVVHFLRDQGLSVPDDVSVTGYEDGLLTEHMIPRLTSVNTKKSELGRHASRILVNRIENPRAKPVRVTILPELVIRESVRDLREPNHIQTDTPLR